MSFVLLSFDAELLFHNGRSFQGLVKFTGFKSEDAVIDFLLKSAHGTEILEDILVIEDDPKAIHDEDRVYCMYDLYKDPAAKTADQVFPALLEHYRENPNQFKKDMDNTWEQSGCSALALVRDDEKLFQILKTCNNALTVNYRYQVTYSDDAVEIS